MPPPSRFGLKETTAWNFENFPGICIINFNSANKVVDNRMFSACKIMYTLTDGRSDGRSDERTDGRMVGRTDARSDGRADGLADGQAVGRTVGWTDGRTDGRKADRIA